MTARDVTLDLEFHALYQRIKERAAKEIPGFVVLYYSHNAIIKHDDDDGESKTYRVLTWEVDTALSESLAATFHVPVESFRHFINSPEAVSYAIAALRWDYKLKEAAAPKVYTVDEQGKTEQHFQLTLALNEGEPPPALSFPCKESGPYTGAGFNQALDEKGDDR